MPVAVTARAKASNDFAHVAKQLRQAGTGGKELRRDLYRGINRSVKPLTAKVKADTGRYLPDQYAVDLARSLRVKVRRRATGQNPAVFLVATANTRPGPRTKGGRKRDLGGLNRGRLRHPLYGNRRHWYDQPVKAGWWSNTLDEGAPRVRRELIAVIDDINRKLSRG